jgi:Holliday junction resolvase
MTNSRRKGADGERELALYLRNSGWRARRGQQYCGANGDADVVGLPGVHIECKRVEKLNIYKAMEQSSSDCKGSEVPVVMHRKNKCRWLVTMCLNDWIHFYNAYDKCYNIVFEEDE